MEDCERFRPIKSLPGYWVSNYGRVITNKGIGRTGILLKRRLVKGTFNRYRYLQRDHHKYYFHRLVLEAFVGPCPPGMEANHKDGNKNNLNVNNLEWITPSQNCKHAYKLGLMDNKGENHPRSKFKDGEIWLMRKILKAKVVKQVCVAKMFKTSPTNISDIKLRHTWTHI